MSQDLDNLPEKQKSVKLTTHKSIDDEIMKKYESKKTKNRKLKA